MNPEQKAINERWTKGSANYDRIIHDELASFRVEGWRQLIASQTGSHPGLKVLDCGCGPAFFTIILAKAGYHVTGIDAAEGMLQKARANVAEYGADAQIMEMDWLVDNVVGTIPVSDALKHYSRATVDVMGVGPSTKDKAAD